MATKLPRKAVGKEEYYAQGKIEYIYNWAGLVDFACRNVNEDCSKLISLLMAFCRICLHKGEENIQNRFAPFLKINKTNGI